MNATKNPKKVSGGVTNLNQPPKGVYGMTKATPTTAKLDRNNALLGLLFQKGDFLVLIANMTSVWVDNDSMNHAV